MRRKEIGNVFAKQRRARGEATRPAYDCWPCMRYILHVTAQSQSYRFYWVLRADLKVGKPIRANVQCSVRLCDLDVQFGCRKNV